MEIPDQEVCMRTTARAEVAPVSKFRQFFAGKREAS
jgi:hypothetical protein